MIFVCLFVVAVVFFFLSSLFIEVFMNVINPLSPDIKMHILLTVLHTFVMELVRRICINIKTSCPW